MLLTRFSDSKLIECGCDEAGRGCLAGPVYAAAVILPADFYDPMLDDSKKLPPAKRERLRKIIEKEAVAWAVTAIEADEIDRINILNASIEAMRRSVASIIAGGTIPELLLIDGNRFYGYENIPYRCIVKGDGKYASIAAASILAKTHRDERVRGMAAEYPVYGWEKNMAYPTKAHREAIRRYGISPYHRKSFRLLDNGEPELF